jgi:hypothetical protein
VRDLDADLVVERFPTRGYNRKKDAEIQHARAPHRGSVTGRTSGGKHPWTG